MRTEADAAAAAAETERLLGLQEQRTSAEDPRILEGGRLRMKATPALEQLTIREVARAVHLSPQPPDPSVPAGYGNLSPSLSGKPEAGASLYLLETGRSSPRSAWTRALPPRPIWRIPAGSCTACP